MTTFDDDSDDNHDDDNDPPDGRPCSSKDGGGGGHQTVGPDRKPSMKCIASRFPLRRAKKEKKSDGCSC